MVLAQVEHRRRHRVERPRRLELITRELERPGGRRHGARHERIEHGRRDVAGHFAVNAGAAQQVTGECGHGALTVGAGHGKHRRTVFPGEKLDVAEHRNAARQGLAHERLGERQTRTDADEVHVGEQRRRESTEPQIALQLVTPRRCNARIGDPHERAAALGVARDREPGIAKTEHQHPPALQRHGRRLRQQVTSGLAHHRSLSVERPKSTSIMVMIQKRTTTWLSFQPSSS